MNFSNSLPALATKALGDSADGTTTTKEIAVALGLPLDEAVGAYEAYNKDPKRHFDFGREFGSRDREFFDWRVTIKKV